MRRPVGPVGLVVLSGLATLLFLESARAFFSTIYYRNLTTLGINASVLNALLLLAPVLFLLPAVSRDAGRTLAGAAVALGALRLAANFAEGTAAYLPLAGLAAASWLVLVPALARVAVGEAGGIASVGAGLALGVATDAALMFVGASRDLSTGVPGLLLVLPAAAAVAALALRARVLVPAPPVANGGVVLAGLALGAWLFLEFAVLGAPYHVARWNAAPIPSAAISTVLGLLLGASLVLLPIAGGTRGALFVAGNVAVAAFLVDHAFAHSRLVPILLLAAQAGMVLNVVAIAETLGEATLRRAGLAVLAGAALLLVLLFAFAFAFQFAFVPLSALWEGRAPHLLVLAFVLLAAGALRGAGRGRLLPSARLPTPLVAALLVGPALAAGVPLLLPAADVAAPAADGTIRVLSFNVHQGFNNDGVIDPEIFVDVVREANADIVLLQESDTPRFTSANLDVVNVLARTLGYHVYYGPPTREQNVGLTLLSRGPILDASHVKLPSESDNRFVLKARVLLNGTEVGVVGVHMGLPAADRQAQIAVILAEAAKLPSPRILVGDFNSCPEGLCPGDDEPPDTVYQQVAAQYADAWVAAGNAATSPAGLTFDAANPHQRIDYVFVSPSVAVVDARPVRTAAALAASDHLPVVADLRL